MMAKLAILMCLVLHILMAHWIYVDAKKRNVSPLFWVVVAAISGLPGALLYAVARLGDINAGKQKEKA